MTTAGEAFKAGDIEGAVAAATAAVKAAPRDAGARWLLSEMLLFAGEYERADRALDAVIEETPSPTVMEFRQLLRAEVVRRQVFTEGRVPKFQGDDPTEAQKAAAQAVTLLRAGDHAGAAASGAEVEAQRPRTPGKIDGVAFDDLRDADDVLAAFIEVHTSNGDYMWVPVERLAALSFDEPKRPRDLYWRRCNIATKDGQEGVVYMPTIYPWTVKTLPNPLRLGRGTEWQDDAGLVRGLGMREFLIGEEAKSLAELTEVTFD
ncbi:tetratricopeptide repeat protein [Roseomonas terrae]|jgi:type VI secretion system protein ImpE|uniref:Tetratricopeptide repeat protein n=1 Tax=Neoroseomonas terrae TaxID=424799 RepID=A0ABS5EH14_9PROT|nr:type VI secretion system accessory protein TagJ [Neoroseomonas terrae]MBR0650305.1 tetratricopeptide repeat protein [Neoroseomonas terrae]